MYLMVFLFLVFEKREEVDLTASLPSLNKII